MSDFQRYRGTAATSQREVYPYFSLCYVDPFLIADGATVYFAEGSVITGFVPPAANWNVGAKPLITISMSSNSATWFLPLTIWYSTDGITYREFNTVPIAPDGGTGNAESLWQFKFAYPYARFSVFNDSGVDLNCRGNIRAEAL